MQVRKNVDSLTPNTVSAVFAVDGDIEMTVNHMVEADTRLVSCLLESYLDLDVLLGEPGQGYGERSGGARHEDDRDALVRVIDNYDDARGAEVRSLTANSAFVRRVSPLPPSTDPGRGGALGVHY